jgi:hypothetical protein
MKHHKWRVGLLAEMSPAKGGLVATEFQKQGGRVVTTRANKC